MPLESLSLALKLITAIAVFGILHLEILNLTLQCRDLVIPQFLSNSAVILQVCQLLAPEKFLIVHFCQSPLSLHMLVVKILIVLNLSVQLL